MIIINRPILDSIFSALEKYEKPSPKLTEPKAIGREDNSGISFDFVLTDASAKS